MNDCKMVRDAERERERMSRPQSSWLAGFEDATHQMRLSPKPTCPKCLQRIRVDVLFGVVLPNQPEHRCAADQHLRRLSRWTPADLLELCADAAAESIADLLSFAGGVRCLAGAERRTR